MVTGITEFPTGPIAPKVVDSEGTTQCNTPYTFGFFSLFFSSFISSNLSLLKQFEEDLQHVC